MEQGFALIQRLKSSAKTRTGCITCTKPRCRRCVELHIECEGYPAVAALPASFASQAAASLSIQDPGDSPFRLQERRALAFFQTRTAPWLSGFLDDDIWSYNVLQMAQTVPAIYHAACGVAALHECQITRHSTAEPNAYTDAGVVRMHEQQYARALVELEKLVGSNQPANNAVLTAAMLCVQFEAMRENFQAAIIHGESVVKSLNSMMSSADEPAERELVRAVMQLDLLASVNFEERLPAVCFGASDDDAALPDRFQSLTHARSIINARRLQLIRFVRMTANKYRYQNVASIPSDVVNAGQQYERAFRRLDDLCFQLLHHSGRVWTDREQRALSILHVRVKLNQIQSGTCLSCNEPAFDGFVSHFEDILTMCTAVLGASDQSTTLWTPTVDDGILWPLAFTAAHCRDGRIRHQALRQLRGVPGAERMWHVKSWTRAVDLWIRHEEQSAGIAPGRDSVQDIPEWARVHMSHYKGLEAHSPKEARKTYLKTCPFGLESGWQDIEYPFDDAS